MPHGVPGPRYGRAGVLLRAAGAGARPCRTDRRCPHRVPGMRRGFLALAAVAFLSAGCIGPMNLRAVRLGGGWVTSTGSDLWRTGNGPPFDIEIAIGQDTDPAFGPIYFGFAYSYVRLDEPGSPDDTYEHRAGTRWRSSMLEETTSIYPYASVGVYLGWMELGYQTAGRLGFGVEGGYGVRLGLGSHAAIDLEMIYSYSFYGGDHNATQMRLGGALVIKY